MVYVDFIVFTQASLRLRVYVKAKKNKVDTVASKASKKTSKESKESKETSKEPKKTPLSAKSRSRTTESVKWTGDGSAKGAKSIERLTVTAAGPQVVIRERPTAEKRAATALQNEESTRKHKKRKKGHGSDRLLRSDEPEKHPYDDEEDSTEKQEMREEFIESVAPCPDAYIFILDGKHIRLSEAMIQRGIKDGRIVVGERIMSTYNEQLKKANNLSFYKLHVRFTACILTDLLRSVLDGQDRSVPIPRAIFFDGMSPDLSAEQLQVLVRWNTYWGKQYRSLFITLCARGGKNIDNRVERIQTALTTSTFGMLRLCAYRRQQHSMTMFVLMFGPMKAGQPTEYQPRRIVAKLGSNNYEVAWYGSKKTSFEKSNSKAVQLLLINKTDNSDDQS